MEVILLHDVENVGHEGDVVKVADGFARNYLMPRSLAMQATRGAKKQLQDRERAIARRAQEKAQAAQSTAERLAAQPIVVRAHVGEGGRLHGQITPQAIVAAIAEQIGLELARRDIEIAEPIRQVGDYFVRATIYKGVHATVPISVIADQPEKETLEEEAAAAQAPVDLSAAQAETAAGADQGGKTVEQSEPEEEVVGPVEMDR